MITETLPATGRTQAQASGNPWRRVRFGAILASLGLIHGCVDGGSSPPETNLDNSAPVANAGPDQTVFTQGPVALNGTGTTDPDGDGFSYSWEFDTRPAGSGATLTGAGTASPTFTPDVPGSYVIRLTAADGFPDSTGTDTVTVTAGVPPPVANAGPDQGVSFAAPGVTVQLNGSASSDPSSLPLTYAWEILGFVPSSGNPPASSVVLVNPNTANPSFAVNAADQLGAYTLRLTVNNGTLSASDQVSVTVASIAAPVADAGDDQDVTFVVAGTTVTLDGTGSSDPSSLALAYTWEILSFQPTSGDPPANAAALVGASTATPTFDVTAIDQLGTYTIQLTVSNGTLATTDQVVVTVAKSFPLAGALLGGGLLASASAAWRRQWRKLKSARRRHPA
ncbi:MAG: PKD domain-containing protein [Gammaproteobacteria bacterium]